MGPEGTTTKRLGAAYELFEESVLDIAAWIDFAQQAGYPHILLDGHSSGASKVSFYLSKTRDPRVSGLILIAPADDLGLQADFLGSKYAEALRRARALVQIGRGSELMPPRFSHDPLSAISYLNMFRPDSPNGIFHLKTPPTLRRSTNDLLAGITGPVLLIIGSADNSLRQAADKFLQLIADRCSSQNIRVKVIQGASHGFSRQENELATVIAEWVTTLTPQP